MAAAAADTGDTGFPPQGIYEIRSSLDDGFVLDLMQSPKPEKSSVEVQMFRPVQVKQQEFYLEFISEHCCRIISLLTGQYLAEGELSRTTIDGGEDREPLEIVTAPVILKDIPREEIKEHPSAVWNLVSRPDGSYLICSKNRLYLTLTSGRLYNGTKLTLTGFTGERDQKWVLSQAPVYPEGAADTDAVNPYGEDGALEDTSITVIFKDDRESLSAETLSSWMVTTADVSEEENAYAHDWTLSEEKITDFVAYLAEQYNTVGVPRSFVTSYGNTITLYKGSFGWKLNQDAMIRRIKKAVSMPGTHRIFPVWSQKGGDMNGVNTDIGDSYVEIDLENQKVWLYKDGEKLLETDCVSGTADTERETPGGVYFIYYKQSPAVLTGADYSSPVTYWMPFNGNIGLHDASWRSTFGGDIFKTNGSHGCVNLPGDAAKLIYETTKIGYPVVCYH